MMDIDLLNKTRAVFEQEEYEEEDVRRGKYEPGEEYDTGAEMNLVALPGSMVLPDAVGAARKYYDELFIDGGGGRDAFEGLRNAYPLNQVVMRTETFENYYSYILVSEGVFQRMCGTLDSFDEYLSDPIGDWEDKTGGDFGEMLFSPDGERFLLVDTQGFEYPRYKLAFTLNDYETAEVER